MYINLDKSFSFIIGRQSFFEKNQLYSSLFL